MRITHIPSGFVVTCQAGRSQIKNREKAMKMLRSKLYEKKMEEQTKHLAEIRGEQQEIGWGSQIRSYVFHPYAWLRITGLRQKQGMLVPLWTGIWICLSMLTCVIRFGSQTTRSNGR